MQQLAYFGEMERVDMRSTVGYALDDESKEALAFIFYGNPGEARASKRTLEEHAAAGEQHKNGVEMTNEKALAILTSPYCPAGFFEVAGEQPQPATVADAQMISPDTINALTGPGEAARYDVPEAFTPAATQPEEPEAPAATDKGSKGSKASATT